MIDNNFYHNRQKSRDDVTAFDEQVKQGVQVKNIVKC